jgi:hypothetical protein
VQLGPAPVSGNVPAPNGSVLVTIPVNVRVNGTYAELTQFLNEIESLRRAMVVSGFDVNYQEKKKDAAEDPGTAAANTGEPGHGPLTMDVTTSVMMTTKAPAPVAVPVAPPADATK